MGVVMDTTRGEITFVVNGVSLGVAYEGVPLDKPLVPCVIFYSAGDSVKLELSEVKEKRPNSAISAPSNITTESTMWDRITLSWNIVKGASFYQIEMDGSRHWIVTTERAFTKKELLPDTEHSFRVRAVCGNDMSECSCVVRGRTQNVPEFIGCVWKECPKTGSFNESKYIVNKECPRVVTKSVSNGCYCVIGSSLIPLNKVTSWSVKVLVTNGGDGHGIYVGVAPCDIDQSSDFSRYKCGWYFHCYDSELCSGPPHEFSGKEYGPRKKSGKYVHTGDSVGVVMDTTKGEVSFVLNSVSLGVAYEGIALDKPLVPCVLLSHLGDSVELIA